MLFICLINVTKLLPWYYHYKNEFPTLLSYTRFLEVMPSVLVGHLSLLTLKLSRQVLSLLILQIKVATTYAFRAHFFQRIEVQWVDGLELHIITNHLGDIGGKLHLEYDDRKPVRELSKGLLDKLYADKGYISKALTEDLKEDRITLITTHRKNMKPKVSMLLGIELCCPKGLLSKPLMTN